MATMIPGRNGWPRLGVGAGVEKESESSLLVVELTTTCMRAWEKEDGFSLLSEWKIE
jgi:hypothetical protein